MYNLPPGILTPSIVENITHVKDISLMSCNTWIYNNDTCIYKHIPTGNMYLKGILYDSKGSIIHRVNIIDKIRQFTKDIFSPSTKIIFISKGKKNVVYTLGGIGWRLKNSLTKLI